MLSVGTFLMPKKNDTVLIIENDPPTLELYRRELSRDYTVLACLTGDAAMELVSSGDLCAVVLEPAMEGGAGWNLLARLNRALQDRRVPIILCSTQDECRRGMEQGAAAYLLKPVLPVLLRDTLRQFVR